MKKPKANITLTGAAQVSGSGIRLALRKGICELRRPAGRAPEPMPIPKGRWEKKISVILCTAGVCSGLSEAVDSALAQTMRREDYEVLVVWNREDAPPITAFSPLVRWVKEPKPGISYARNTGAAHAKGEFLLYMDDDAVADKNLAARMAASFRGRSDTAIVGGQIFLKLPEPRPEAVLPGHEGLWSAYRVPYSRYKRVREQYAFPYGACFAVRHSALDALGGFPTDYGRVGAGYEGGEETALCFMALQRGWKIGIQPKAWVEHHVEPWRFSREHVRKTIRAGILTTYRLFRDGYAPRGWDLRYVRERLEIAEEEWNRLRETGTEWEQYYKECEREAFWELLQEMEEA
ncbi:MAG: glycosyltransferase family 2 protein [Clostridia bacterium]|nr:glycosyltransferase family 2 protein [Clostridia bacterium]